MNFNTKLVIFVGIVGLSLVECSFNIRMCCPKGKKFDVNAQECIESRSKKVLTVKNHSVELCRQSGVMIKKINGTEFLFGKKFILNFVNHNKNFSYDNYCVNSFNEVMICEKIGFVKLCCKESEVFDTDKQKCVPKSLEIDVIEFINHNGKIIEEEIKIYNMENFYSRNVTYGMLDAKEIKVFQNGTIKDVDDVLYDNYCFTNDGQFLVAGVSTDSTDFAYLEFSLKFISLWSVIVIEYLYWSKRKANQIVQDLLFVHFLFVGLYFVLSITDDAIYFFGNKIYSESLIKLPLLCISVSSFTWLTLVWIAKILNVEYKNKARWWFGFYSIAVTIPLSLMIVLSVEGFTWWHLFSFGYFGFCFILCLNCFIHTQFSNRDGREFVQINSK